MAPTANLIPVGRLGRTHGLKGELKVVVEEAFEDPFFKAGAVFVEVRGTAIPHFIEYVRGGGAPIVKFEDVDTIEQARLLQGLPLLMPSDALPDISSIPSEEAQFAALFAQLKGFNLHDATLGPIGPIREVQEMPGQWMAFVDTPAGLRMVPLHPHLMQDINERARILLMDLPEGLLDLE